MSNDNSNNRNFVQEEIRFCILSNPISPVENVPRNMCHISGRYRSHFEFKNAVRTHVRFSTVTPLRVFSCTYIYVTESFTMNVFYHTIDKRKVTCHVTSHKKDVRYGLHYCTPYCCIPTHPRPRRDIFGHPSFA